MDLDGDAIDTQDIGVKNIVLCSDGTGNSAGKGRGTNVWKIFEAVDLTGHKYDPLQQEREQVAFYDDGVGTEKNKAIKILTGAVGYGLGRNVRQLYTALCRAYRPDDRIYLFGFSRGAFTVRTLAGLIDECGVIDGAAGMTPADLDEKVGEAYRAFRKHFRTKWFWWKQTELRKMAKRATGRFRAENSVRGADGKQQIPIRFLGVWDTVDAVGLPWDGLAWFVNNFICAFRFPDQQLSKSVDKGCHAISIDDERHTFHPVMWDEIKEDPGSDRIEQVWFAGVHSNVGGGYPKEGLSLVALDWMMRRAEKAELRLVKSEWRRYRNRLNPHDKLYNSRAGISVFYRYKPRDIEGLCRKYGVAPKIHVSALERLSMHTQGYAPGNLPPDFQIEPSDPEIGFPSESPQALEQVRVQVREASRSRPRLLEVVRNQVSYLRSTHYAFLLLISILSVGVAFTLRDGRTAVSVVLVGLVMLALAFYAFGISARAAMERKFALFWARSLPRPWWGWEREKRNGAKTIATESARPAHEYVGAEK